MIKDSMNNECPVCSGRDWVYSFSRDGRRFEECGGCGVHMLLDAKKKLDLPPILNANEKIFGEVKDCFNVLNIETSQNESQKTFLYISSLQYKEALDIDEIYLDGAINPYVVVKMGRADSFGVRLIDELPTLDEMAKINYLIFDQVLNKLEKPQTFFKNTLKKVSVGCKVLVRQPCFNSIRSMENGAQEICGKWFMDEGSLKRFMRLNGCVQVHADEARSKSINYLNNYESNNLISAIGVRKNDLDLPYKLDVIMPVFNEVGYVSEGIDRVLNKEVEGLEINLIIVESNSTDGSRDQVLKYKNNPRVRLVLQDRPMGKGNAVREGFKHIQGDFILIQDADNEYDIEDYDSLLRPLLRAEAAFVLGARHGGKAWKMRHFQDQEITSHFLNFGHVLFTFLVNIFYGLSLKDPFTMYKIFRSDCIDGIQFKSNRFDFDYELLIKLTKAGYIPIEIPVNYRSRSFVQGKKVRMIRDPLNWLWAIIKFKF